MTDEYKKRCAIYDKVINKTTKENNMTFISEEQKAMMALCKAFPELTFMEVMAIYNKEK